MFRFEYVSLDAQFLVCRLFVHYSIKLLINVVLIISVTVSVVLVYNY